MSENLFWGWILMCYYEFYTPAAPLGLNVDELPRILYTCRPAGALEA